MPDIELTCDCGSSECFKGIVFTANKEPDHYRQGYIDIFGSKDGVAGIMLSPESMQELRDWLIEMYPLEVSNKIDTGTENNATSDWLRDLAERLRQVPVMYGIDDGDIDRCMYLASKLVHND